MTQTQKNRLLVKIEAMENSGTYQDRKRANEARRLLGKADRNDGAAGLVEEVLAACPTSRKKRVSPQGTTDNFLRVRRADGKIISYGAERKTSGGRITNLLKKNPPRFIIYSYDIDNSIATDRMEARIYKTSTFLEILEETEAIKNTNGIHPEPAIQVVKKQWRIAISEAGLPYDRTKIYTEAEVEAMQPRPRPGRRQNASVFFYLLDSTESRFRRIAYST